MPSLRIAALLALAFAAPMQCPSPHHPELAREESPGESLWLLAERFGAAGDAPARAATLRFLVERHPTSRFAERARLELGGDAGR